MAARTDYVMDSFCLAMKNAVPIWKVWYQPTGEIVFKGQCTRWRVEELIKLDMEYRNTGDGTDGQAETET